MSLSKDQRDALPEGDFAVPGKRALPMHDATHVRLAWDMVDRTGDLTDSERREARRRIIRKAHELGVDTSGWGAAVHAAVVAIQAMSLAVPETPNHPNKRPFSGILTRIDEPSDKSPDGSGGRLVLLTKAAAEAALPTLLGMAVDCSIGLDAHAETRKIGIITSADIVDNAIAIEGYFFAQDFPGEMRKITAEKSKLGFSFELTPTSYTITQDNLFRVDSCVFTGAALLYKAKAAYQTTALAAAHSTEASDVELKDLTDKVGALDAGLAKLTGLVEGLAAKAADPALQANAHVREMVEPHAKGVESCAAAMEAAGVGMAPTNGHVAHLRRMAGSMRAEAAMGKLPHIYRDHDYAMGAAAAEQKTDPAVMDIIKTMQTGMAEIKTGMTELKGAHREAAQQPQRKTLPAEATKVLKRFGLTEPGDGEGVDYNALGAAMTAAGIPLEARMTVKRTMERAEAGLPN
jgi:hypothetical protein